MNRSLPRVFIIEDEPMVRDQLFYYLEDFEEFRLTSQTPEIWPSPTKKKSCVC